MSSVLRMVVSDETSPAGIPASDGSSSTAASDAQLAAGHLVRCPACGALNGRSVTACWSCESELSRALRAKRRAPAAASNAGAGSRPAHESAPAPSPAVAEAPVQANERSYIPAHESSREARLDTSQEPAPDAVLDMTVLLGTAAWDAGALKSSLPVLTSPVSAITPLTPIYRLGGAASFTRPQRPRWGLFAIVGVALLFVAAGGYELLRDDPSDQARSALAAVPLRSDAVQSAPGENLSATRGATVRVPGDMSHVDEALRTAELVGRASPMEDVAEPAVAPAAGLGAGPVAGLAAGPAAGPGFVPARPLASSALAHRADSAVALAPVTSRRGKTATHGSSRFTSSRAAAEPVAAAPQRQYDSRGTRPAPVGSFGPCTSTVAALGLCTPASPSQPKE